MTKISVIIPLYNKAPYVERAIKSILNQTFDNFEIIVVDDGSSDDSVSIVKTIDSPKIKLYQKENGGPSTARNMGVRVASGDWIMLLDADDMLMPYALEIFSKLIKKYPKENYFVGNYFNMFSESNILENKGFSRERKLNNSFYYEATRQLTETSGTVLIKKQILKDEPFNEKLRRYEDAERQYRIMRRLPLIVIPTPISIIDRTSAAASKPRNNPDEDFVCNLNFDNKSYWEQLCLYILSLDCLKYYPNKAYLYEKIYKRWDLKLGFYYLRFRRSFMERFGRKSRKKQCYTLDELMSMKCINIE